MAYIETKDPFGFVGSHVVRKQSRRNGDEHGWLTRYDDALDYYTLFVPGGGEPRFLARGEVMKFLSAPNIELHHDDQDDFPPPVKDTTTSRYLGVTVCAARRNKRSSRGDEGKSDQDRRGHVTCFLPFADQYTVKYDDGVTEDVSESAVIDGMIALIKSSFFSSSNRTKARNGAASSGKDLVIDKIEPVRRKRQRVETTNGLDVKKIPCGTVAVVKDEVEKQEGDDVVCVDQKEVITGVKKETAPNYLEIMSSSASDSDTHENSLEMASRPLDTLRHVETGDGTSQDDSVAMQGHQKEQEKNKPAVDAMPADAALEAPKKVPFYIVDAKPQVVIEPLPRRTMAFEILRASLLNLLDRREASAVKTTLQTSLLRNSDVRDRDAVIRFVTAGGLLVLNHLLNLFAAGVHDDGDEESNESGVDDSRDKMQDLMKRDDELFHVMKLVAMLPTPSRNQVIASNIGKTINYLSKTHGPPNRQSALPKCITALAKWIKISWIKNIPSAPKPASKASIDTLKLLNRPQQQARRGGHRGSSKHSSHQVNRRQPPPSQRPQRQDVPAEDNASIDHTSIPRRPRPRQVAHPQQPVDAYTPSQLSVPRRVQGSLKPDWMRRREHLSRSRFCIEDSINVDTRPSRTGPSHSITNIVSPSAQAITQQVQNPDQHEDAGGPDGVFGRAQKLRFGKRWSIQEFEKKDPPGTLKRSLKSRNSLSSNGHSQYSGQHVLPMSPSSRQPRPILRRVSRYNDEPVIDGRGR